MTINRKYLNCDQSARGGPSVTAKDYYTCFTNVWLKHILTDLFYWGVMKCGTMCSNPTVFTPRCTVSSYTNCFLFTTTENPWFVTMVVGDKSPIIFDQCEVLVLHCFWLPFTPLGDCPRLQYVHMRVPTHNSINWYRALVLTRK